MGWPTVLHVAQYTVGGPFYGWPNYGRKLVLDYIAQRGNDTGRFPRAPKRPASTFSFKSDASVESNVERANIIARGYGGVVVKEKTARPQAESNLQLGHFFPVAPSLSIGQGTRLGYR